MIHHRPNIGALDVWAEAVGDDAYTFDNLLPYFKKSVTFTPPNSETRLENATTLYNISDFDEDGGPVQVTYPNWTPVWSTWAAKGLEAIGINMTDKYDEGSLLGCFYAQLTVEPTNQVRSTSAEFIYAAQDQDFADNLTVYLEARADKILFDDTQTARAVQVTGVDLLTYTINATKEVILSAGSLHSPQLLMLSGIGPAQVLNEYAIDVIADRPGVGQNLTDHVLFGPAYEVEFDTLDEVLGNPVVLAESVSEYALTQTGPLTTNVAEFLACERMPASANLTDSTRQLLDSYPDDWPHIEYFPADGYIGNFNVPFLDQPKDGKQYAQSSLRSRHRNLVAACQSPATVQRTCLSLSHSG